MTEPILVLRNRGDEWWIHDLTTDTVVEQCKGRKDGQRTLARLQRKQAKE